MSEGEKLCRLMAYIDKKFKGDAALLWKALLADRLAELKQ